MSRIGNAPVQIPDNVTVDLSAESLVINGPLGSLKLELRPEVQVEKQDQQLIVKRKKEDKISKSLHGLTRSLIANMVAGVDKGWVKNLEMVGVGYRAQTSGDQLTLNVGFSHPVEIAAPEGIKFAVLENTKISISGRDKHMVGQIAAIVRSAKPPEPYQGKGIRFAGERVKRKAGKASKAATK